MSVAVDNAAVHARTFSKTRRAWLAAVGVGLLTLLATARTLQPDSNGYGTHQQLGLPPCTFKIMFGKRCPSCGMTTSWAYLTRGRLDRAAQSNFGGLMLGVIASAAAPWLIASALRGRWWLGAPKESWALGVALAIAVVTLLDWGWRLWSG